MAEIFFRKKTCSMVETLKIVGPIFTGALKPPSQTERTGEGAQIIDLLVNSYSVKVKIKSLGLLLQIETYHKIRSDTQ